MQAQFIMSLLKCRIDPCKKGEGMGRHPLAVPGFCLGGKNGVWVGDDDQFLFSTRGLPTPVSWLGNHTKRVIAAMASMKMISHRLQGKSINLFPEMPPFMNVYLFPDEDEKPYSFGILAMSASWANNVIPRVTVEAIVALLAPVLKELTEKTYLKSAEVVDIVLGSVSESGFQTASKCRMAGFLCWISWLNLLRIRAEAALTSDQLLYSIRDGGFQAAAIKETHRLRRTSSSSNSRKRNKVHKNLVVLEDLGSELIQELLNS
ncbi:hypothetical protein Tco_0770320 [Tanacetum coccineum]|uniref:Uncharacterized protein n=1 Tax=Tanacetum coccineum TaxID=301880 RepID=A0ABQ4ZBV5_9ASTR